MGLKNLHTAANKLNFKPFGIIPAEYDLSYFESSSVPAGATTQRYVPAESPDGVITDFTLPVNLVVGTDIVVVNNLAYNRGVMYAMVGQNVVRFQPGYIPASGWAIYVYGVEDA